MSAARMSMAIPAIVALLSSGCTLATTKRVYLHSLTVDGNGDPQHLRVRGLDLSDEDQRDFRKQVRLMAEDPGFRNAKRFLIYVHGGLNSLRGGLERARRDLDRIEGDLKHEGTYPIFINWESGMFNALMDHYFRIRGGAPAWWAVPTFPFFLLADLGRAASRAPIVLTSQLLDTHHLFLRVRARSVPPQWTSRANLVDTVDKDDGLFLYDWATSLTCGLVRPVTTLLFDTGAFAGYPLILRRIDTLFRRDRDVEDRTDPSGAIPELMRILPPDKPVTLIGHSMGTIVLNELIRHHGDRVFDRIVYMGAACSIEDFANTVPAYLKRRPEARMHILTLHPEAERSENSAFSLLPHGSLLHWLDSFVLGPRTALQKTLGQWNNLMKVLGVLEPDLGPIRDRLFIKGFPIDGDRFPSTHGSFDEYRYWRPEFWDPFSGVAPERNDE
jgi:pimeloyl-ACP methyl ester carboxylesterase